MSTSKYSSDISDIVKFRLKARQSGFKVVDRIEMHGGGDGIVCPFTTHQFYLEGTPLPAISPQSQPLRASHTTR